MMKKNLYLTGLSTLIVLLSLVSGVSPAFAATKHATVSQVPSAIILRAEPSGWHPSYWQTHNQYFHGNSYSHIHLTFRGHNQNNSGNQGHNRGYNRNFGSNAGNLIVNHGGSSRYQRTNQYFSGNSYSRNHGYFIGYNQNNTGNQGYNEGYNEDHGGNGGNQIVN